MSTAPTPLPIAASSAEIRVVVNLGPDVTPARTTLGRFLADNADGFDADEIADIERTLVAGQTYSGGGGAAPAWTLSPA